MDGAQRHDDDLIAMFAALKAKHDALLRELAEVDRDMDAVWRTASIELRSRQAAATAGGSIHAPPAGRIEVVRLSASANAPARTLALEAPAAAERKDDGPVLVRQGTPHSGRSIPPDPGTLAALATLGPVRDDKALPPAVDANGQRLEVAGIPTGGTDLAVAKAAVQAVADLAREAPPGKGGRRHVSSRGLVPGEPMMPALRNVLAAARRPMTSHEAALALLAMRKLNFEGQELVAVVNRVSALFGQEAAKGNMLRTKQEGTRANLWEAVAKEPPLDVESHMRGSASSQPSGSTG